LLSISITIEQDCDDLVNKPSTLEWRRELVAAGQEPQ